MRLTIGILVVLAIAATPAEETGAKLVIEVSASPALPVPNLLTNPSFEKGDEMPDHWGVSTAAPHLFRYCRMPEDGRHGAFLKIDAKSTVMSGYCAQVVKVAPDTLYRVGAWTRLRGGYALLWMHSYVKGRRFDQREKLVSWGKNPLSPDFVPLEWTRSPPPDKWIWLGRELRTWKEQTQVNMHLGSYFERGSMDFDDAFLGLARTTLKVTVSGEEITKITVKNLAGDICWESADLPAKMTRVEQAIPDLPTGTRYQISIRTASGREAVKWYPGAE
ncbi:MAG: hypothetical protein KAI66_09445 [Lentisphaeria bacterium]|nr:hypothetical protein [Lentisphaeria bacterium]